MFEISIGHSFLNST